MEGLIVRELFVHEKTMVLTNWKKDMWGQRARAGWSRGLEERDYWALVNHVVDRITLPSCTIITGCHEREPDVPMCWVALRRVPNLSTFEIVYLYARKSIRRNSPLAAGLERALLSLSSIAIATERRPYNPFLELRR